jgi:hypothetical protein
MRVNYATTLRRELADRAKEYALAGRLPHSTVTLA